MKDHFDHWLSADQPALTPGSSRRACRERLRRRQERDSLAERNEPLIAPGKLADCCGPMLWHRVFWSRATPQWISEAARHRETQAVLPLRGKILSRLASPENSARTRKPRTSRWRWAADCKDFDLSRRYERVIIMTTPCRAHIASF